MYSISMPLFVLISKKGKFYLNMNKYRNAHFHVLNTAKKKFKDIAEAKLKTSSLPYNLNHISIEYVYYNGTHAKSDIANVCSVADKFFSDALVELGYLVDDNYNHLKDIKFTYGGYDKENPRVDINIFVGAMDHFIEPTLISITKESIMKFNVDKDTVDGLLQDYLKEAMSQYVSNLITVKSGVELEVTPEDDGSVTVKLVAGKQPKSTKKVEAKKEEVEVQEVEVTAEPEEEAPFEVEEPKKEPKLFKEAEPEATGKAQSLFGEPKKETAPATKSLFANIAQK